MKNIMLIGNCNSIWIKRYIEKVLLPTKLFNIFIIDFYSYVDGIKFKHFYDINNVNIIHIRKPLSSTRSIIKKIKLIKELSTLIKRLVSVDIVHVHMVSWASVFLLSLIKSKNVRTVITYWGSDLLRESKRNLILTGLLLHNADVITLPTSDMINRFKKVYGHKYDKKIETLLFGITGYDYIKKINKSQSLKCDNNISHKKQIVISIGYNGAIEQQHIPVIQAISKLKEETKDNITIILPMTYGLKNENYKTSICEELGKYNLKNYRIYTQYLEEEQYSKLICSSDIFIHAQTTDAFSATVQEYLYAKKIVLSPSWINYKELDERNVYIVYYNTFEDLTKKLEFCIRNKDTEVMRTLLDKNTSILENFNGWDNVAKKWLSLY